MATSSNFNGALSEEAKGIIINLDSSEDELDEVKEVKEEVKEGSFQKRAKDDEFEKSSRTVTTVGNRDDGGKGKRELKRCKDELDDESSKKKTKKTN